MDFQQRQVSRMRSEISDYRAGRLSLNSLIGNIEGLARALDEEFWGDEVFPIVLALEQTNIDLLTPGHQPTAEEREVVDRLLAKLHEALDHFQV